MSSYDKPALHSRLRSSDDNIFEDAVRDAIANGTAGDNELSALLDEDIDEYRRLVAVVAIGDSEGPTGAGALRSLLATANISRDVRCSALLALTKRCHEAATPDLAVAMLSNDEAAQEYAILGLAAFGDDRCWEAGFEYLADILNKTRHRSPVPPTDCEAAICYLGRHLAGRTDDDRAPRVVRLIRERWGRLSADEQQWLRQWWPASSPNGGEGSDLELPDGDALASWIRACHLFEPAV